MPSFTDLTLKNLPIPLKGQVTHKDAGSPLSIRVSQGGSKTFFVTLDGSGRRHVIGRYGEVTLAEAREAAKKLRAEKTLGRILPSNIDLARARQEYLDALDVRTNTSTYYRRNLERLKASKLQDISPRDIHKILDQLGSSSRAQAIRTYSAFFNWCIRRHYLDTSPVGRMEPGKLKSRDRILHDAELKQVWFACSDLTNDLPKHFRTIVKLLILTGMRRTECAHLQHAFLHDDQVTLPATMTKNGREFTFPVGPLTQSLLSASKDIRQTLFFPARGAPDRAFNGWSNSKEELDRIISGECVKSGQVDWPTSGPWTLHDLRRTFRSNLGRVGVAPHIAERLVNGDLEKLSLLVCGPEFARE